MSAIVVRPSFTLIVDYQLSNTNATPSILHVSTQKINWGNKNSLSGSFKMCEDDLGNELVYEGAFVTLY